MFLWTVVRTIRTFLTVCVCVQSQGIHAFVSGGAAMVDGLECPSFSMRDSCFKLRVQPDPSQPHLHMTPASGLKITASVCVCVSIVWFFLLSFVLHLFARWQLQCSHMRLPRRLSIFQLDVVPAGCGGNSQCPWKRGSAGSSDPCCFQMTIARANKTAMTWQTWLEDW